MPPSRRAQPITAGLASAGVATLAAAALAGYVLASRRSRSGYSSTQWHQAVDDLGSIPGFEDIARDIAKHGLQPSVRAQVWPFLLGVFDPNSTHEQRQQHHQSMFAAYRELLNKCQDLEAALLQDATQQQQQRQQQGSVGTVAEQPPADDAPQALPEHVAQFGEAHRIIVIDSVRTDFRKQSLAAIDGSSTDTTLSNGRLQLEEWMGGLLRRVSITRSSAAGAGLGDASTSRQAGVTDDSGPAASSAGHLQPLQQQQLQRPPVLWVSSALQQVLDMSPHLDAHSKHQAARLVALLSAYAVHDPHTGYCQGMSDLAVPFITLMDDDALAFACFTAVMARARRNFAVDESGIFAQLRALCGLLAATDRVLEHRLRALGAAECHFAYRMIVVLMRRDLPLAQAMMLWEMLWADDWLASRTASAVGASSSPAMQPFGTAPASRLGQGWTGTTSQGEHSRAPDLFLCFVAAVVISQRRRVLDDCTDTDDVLRLFHSVRVDFWDCLAKAKQMRAKLSREAATLDGAGAAPAAAL